MFIGGCRCCFYVEAISHQKVIDVVGGGTKLLLNNRRWEVVLNHSRAMFRTFLARLIVPTAHIQRDLRATAAVRSLIFVPRPISSAVARLHDGMRYTHSKVLFTAYHGSAAPTGPWRGSIGMLPGIVKAKDLEILAANLLMPK
jgi:hypothetical protein